MHDNIIILLCTKCRIVGLFHRAIAASGSGLAPWAFFSPARSRYSANKLADALDCPRGTSEQLRNCIMAKSAEDISSASQALETWLLHPMVGFSVTAEPPGPAAFLDMHPEQAYAAGHARDIPFMMGLNSDDGCMVVVRECE